MVGPLVHLFGVRLHVYCHVTYDVDKPGKFGHSSQPRPTLVRGFHLRQLLVTTNFASALSLRTYNSFAFKTTEKKNKSYLKRSWKSLPQSKEWFCQWIQTSKRSNYWWWQINNSWHANSESIFPEDRVNNLNSFTPYGLYIFNYLIYHSSDYTTDKYSPLKLHLKINKAFVCHTYNISKNVCMKKYQVTKWLSYAIIQRLGV